MPIPSWILELRKKIGHDLSLVSGVSAMIFNNRHEVLLQHRSDNGLWSTIGGVQEAGEEPADAIVREVFEETALKVEPVAIVGVYLSLTITYPNGDQVQYTTTQFICRPTDPGATPRINDVGHRIDLARCLHGRVSPCLIRAITLGDAAKSPDFCLVEPRIDRHRV